jgi:hypothetical protein
VQGLGTDLCREATFVNVSEPADFDEAPDRKSGVETCNDIIQNHTVARVTPIKGASGERLENVKDPER